jgi:ankyrin repeat protein
MLTMKTPSRAGSIRTLASLSLAGGLVAAAFGQAPTAPPTKPAAPSGAVSPTAPPPAEKAPAKADSPNLTTRNARRNDLSPTQTAPANETVNLTPQSPAISTTRPAGSPTAQASAQAATKSQVRFDPPELDFGDMTADVAMTKIIKICNDGPAPVTITRAIPGCGCTTPSWPKDPIQPGECGEAEITFRPGSKQGIELRKQVTFQLEGYAPVVLTLKGNVAEYVKVVPDLIEAPAPDATAEEAATMGLITLTAMDGTAFKVLSVNPPIVKDLGGEAKLEHGLAIDWVTWKDSGRSPKLAVVTDHPKAPSLTVMVKRSIKDAQGAAPTPPPIARPQPANPIIAAVRANDETALKLQLAGGADVNASDAVGGGRTALHWAVKDGRKNLVSLLLDSKANLEATDRVGKTPLSVACEGKDLEMVTLLVGKGANVNSRDMIGGSPLLWASGLGTPEMVSFLISKSADVNVVDVNGLTPLLWASGIGSPGTVDALIKAGAKVNVSDTITGDTALMRAARTGKPEAVALLLKAGADVNGKNRVGMTPFMLAAGFGSLEKVEMLQAANADLAATDVKGWNALDHARNRVDGEKDKVVAFLEPIVPASAAKAPPQVAPAAAP